MPFNSNSAIISFFPTSHLIKQNRISASFYEDNYVIYYGLYELGKTSYKDLELKSFDIAKVQKGDTENYINFSYFLITILITFSIKKPQFLLFK